MIRKVSIIILIFSIYRIVISCCNGVEIGYNFNYSKISLTIGDNIVRNIVNQKDSILYSDFIAQIEFDNIKVAQLFDNLSNDLYAFDCRSSYDLVNKVKNLKIITLTDFDSLHLKNSELEVSYKILGYTDMGFTGTKDFVINDLNNEGYGEPNAIVYFKFKEKPKTNTSHRFLVKIQFNDNTELTDTTGIVYIKE